MTIENFVVLEWEHRFLGTYAVKISYVEVRPGFWPWSKPRRSPKEAIRGRYNAYFRTLDGQFVPMQVEGLVSVAEALKK